MKNLEKKGITRRESLQFGAGLLAGLIYPSTGIASGRFLWNDVDNSPYSISLPHDTSGKLSEDWVRDLLIIPMPAAALGGKKAGVYTAAENGIVPWNNAIIRWLTSKSVRGNGGVLIRQDGPESGAGLFAVIDPQADYVYEVLIHIPGGSYFGTKQEDDMQLWISVLDTEDKMLAEKQVEIVSGDWIKGEISFSSGNSRMVRCVVYARSVKQYPCMYYVDSFRLTRNDYRWWNPENYFNNSRTIERLVDKRQLLLEQVNPDAVAGHNGVYLNWDGFFTTKGILIGGGNWEQEYNHVSIDDPVLKNFEDNGIARDIDGRKIQTNPLWPGYQMCHNAPDYHEHFIRQVTRIAPEVHLFTQDNINMPSFQGWGKGCFCRWCKDKFNKWLERNQDLPIVRKTGISEFTSFDIGQYTDKIRTTVIKKGNDAVLMDATLKSYLLFQYDSQLNAWRNAVGKIKKAAGHPVAVMGNQYGNNGEKPYSVTLSQISDVVCTESNIGTNHQLGRFDRIKTNLLVKLGLASGEFRRPVWLQYSALFHSPVAPKSRLRFISAQTFANGGISFTWATAPEASGWFYDVETEIYQFVQRYRYLFSRCEGYANVGLIYSLPTHIWRKYNAFNLSPGKYLDWFYSFALMLEEMHVPYEVNCWWHPLLGSDTTSLERLSRYQLLILPGVDCFTEDQLNALYLFQERGGQVIHLECPTLYDQNMEPLPKHITLERNAKCIRVKPELTEDTKHLIKEIGPQIAKSLGEKSLIKTNAPAEVWSNLQMSESKNVLSLHLVNGNINEMDDKFEPVRFTKWKVRLPEGLTVDKAQLICMETPDNVRQIKVDVSNNWASVTVPLIEGYSIVSFYSGNSLEEAEKLAWKRRSDLKNILSM